MARTHYATLGVARDENAGGIVHAFRDLDRHLHPERGGPRGTRQYRRMANAFAVLANRGERRRYDEDLEAEPLVPARSAVQGETTRDQPHLSLERDFEATRPTRSEIAATIRRNFEPRSLPKSGRISPLELYVAQRSDQRDILYLGVPVCVPCATCHGTRHVFACGCPDCDGSGLEVAEEWIRVAPSPSGEAEVSLVEIGIRTLFLRVHVNT